jgi:nucleoid DNA-binding protein
MAKNKTTENENSIADFLASVTDETKRKDSLEIANIFSAQTGFEPKMWGSAIIGFGSYHFKYDSGREGDAPLTGFSPRKDSIALYFSSEFDRRAELLEKFGKHKTGKGCVYIKKLEDVNVEVLKEMLSASAEYYQSKYPR